LAPEAPHFPSCHHQYLVMAASFGICAINHGPRTTRIQPMATADPSHELVREAYDCAYASEGAATRDARGAAARRKLSKSVGAKMYQVDSKVREAILAHNENNRLAVEKGSCVDLPYLEELVNSMRDYQTRLLHSDKRMGERQQRKLLDKLMERTEKRMKDANTDLIATNLGATKVQRKPSADWHILSGTNDSTEYLAYKSKRTNPLGQAANYGMVIVCLDETSKKKKGADDDGSRDILSIMQHAHYVQNMLVYTSLECLHNIEFANELLLRLQQKETEHRTPLSDSACMLLREQLYDLEADLQDFAESHGRNTAERTGKGFDNYELKGSITDQTEELLTELFRASEQLKDLLKSIGKATKDLGKVGQPTEAGIAPSAPTQT